MDEAEQGSEALAAVKAANEKLKKASQNKAKAEADAAQKLIDDEKAAKLKEEMRIIAEKKGAKAKALAETKAKQAAKRMEEAERKRKAAEEDAVACAAAGLAPVPTEIPDVELEALPNFDEIFLMDRAKWDSLPPFRKPMVRKAAAQRYKDKMEAQNRANALEWSKRKDAKASALTGAADQRIKIGQIIAKKGFVALLAGAQSAMEPTSAIAGPLMDGHSSCYGMVWPGVRVPNVTEHDKFLLIFKKAGATKPEKVMHLRAGKFTMKRVKGKGKKPCFQVNAPLIAAGNKFGKAVNVVLGVSSKAELKEWQQAIDKDAEMDEAAAKAADSGDIMSAFDFDCNMPAGPKGKAATLTVTREHVQIFQKGKMIKEVCIKDVRSWAVGATSIGFKMIKGDDVTIGTKNKEESVKIKEAMITQAKAMVQAKKDKAAAANEAKQEEAEGAALAAKEAEEEALNWLTYEELKNGTYDARPVHLIRGEVDEKNKELWLRDQEFVEVFGMDKEAFAKQPAFKKPMLKKKKGLGPYQFNE